ncbi:MAG: glycosyltransferase family 1 protein [Bryobacterales bacterium]|nr:glycosyltransferase family 4 protein [Bryobacteraceae bacterium]MDW8355360.1 glycosyltransferase family 1 protein [Bryobacterales bacterium]
MKVAIDATPLTLAVGGLARYTEQLSLALAATFPGDRYVLLSDQPFPLPTGAPPNLQRGKGPGHPWERRWWLWGLERAMARHGIELFHGTHFEAPLLPRRPAVVTIHDLSPWLDAAWQPDAARVRRRAPLVLGLRLSTMVITPTETVRRQVLERFRLPAARVVAVPLAAADCFRPQPGAPSPVPYFLCVGALEPRKNLATALAAWRELRSDFAVELALVGKPRPDFPVPGPEPGLRLLGPLPDTELARLYRDAVALLYPSLYEGFGLPVLEAMQCGTPVLASRDPAVAEVAGGAALLLDPQDVRSWKEAMHALLLRPELASEWKQKGLARAAEFSWRRTAELTRAVYVEACRRFPE